MANISFASVNPMLLIRGMKTLFTPDYKTVDSLVIRLQVKVGHLLAPAIMLMAIIYVESLLLQESKD